MEYNKNVKDMVPGDKVEGFYILKEAYQKISSNGKPFLSAVIADKTGTMDVKVWDYAGPVGTQEDVGKIIKIRGDVSEFKGNPQLSLSNIRMALPEDNCDTVRLVRLPPSTRTRRSARSAHWWTPWRIPTTARWRGPCWGGIWRPLPASRRPKASITASCRGC